MRRIFKGDIYYVDFNKAFGSEQGGDRPAIILQNNIGNKYSPTTIVAPLTRKILKQNTHVFLPASDEIKYESKILLEQNRKKKKKRLQNFLGKISSEKRQEVDRAICNTFNIKKGEM